MRTKIIGVALLISLAGFAAEQYTLQYQGYPYKKTSCADPTYAAGYRVRLSKGVPERAGIEFLGWEYGGRTYQPGSIFKMPAANVILTPKWNDGQALVDAKSDATRCTKELRDGQLIILRGDKQYTIMGVERR